MSEAQRPRRHRGRARAGGPSPPDALRRGRVARGAGLVDARHQCLRRGRPSRQAVDHGRRRGPARHREGAAACPRIGPEPDRDRARRAVGRAGGGDDDRARLPPPVARDRAGGQPRRRPARPSTRRSARTATPPTRRRSRSATKRSCSPSAARRPRTWTGSWRPLLIHDLPTLVWWPGDPPFADPVFDQLVELSDKLIIDSSDFSDLLLGYRRLANLRRRSGVGDLAWKRLGWWQELTAAVLRRAALPPLPAEPEPRPDQLRPAAGVGSGSSARPA